MGLHFSSYVLQQFATLILFIKIMKGKQKTVLAFSFYNATQANPEAFL